MSDNRRLVLSKGDVVLTDRVLTNTSVVVSNGRVTDITRASSEGQEIDLRSHTLFPGFIDIHIHGAKGIDTLAASAGDLKIVSQFLATQGVTAWLPTLVPATDDQYESAIQAIEQTFLQQRHRDEGFSVDAEIEKEIRQQYSPGARVLGVHYEGPFVNELQCGALRREHLKTFHSAADVDALPVPRPQAATKMMTLAPEIDGGIELVRELVKREWIVSIGHTRADIESLDQALSAGAHHMTHFMNAMAPLHHRAPGPVGWGFLHDEVSCDFIADGIHLDPLVLKLLLQTKGVERLALISDAIAAAGMGDGDYKIWNETIHVQDGRTRNERGSIAGSVISMLDAVRRMRSLGASEIDVSLMAGTNPARLLSLDHEIGSIEVGKRADLVAVDAAGNVKLTIIGGEVAFSALG